MYISRKPGNKKKQPPKPKLNRAQRAKNNRSLGHFVVKSAPGFKIGTVHKFKIFKRNDLIVVEYCEPCAKVRGWFKLDSKDAEYVRVALKKFPSQSLEKYNPQTTRVNFTALLKREFLIRNPRL